MGGGGHRYISWTLVHMGRALQFIKNHARPQHRAPPQSPVPFPRYINPTSKVNACPLLPKTMTSSPKVISHLCVVCDASQRHGLLPLPENAAPCSPFFFLSYFFFAPGQRLSCGGRAAHPWCGGRQGVRSLAARYGSAFLPASGPSSSIVGQPG